MNEVGKTFRKLICNYENAHTSRHRFNFAFFFFSFSAQERVLHVMWKLHVVSSKPHEKKKFFSEILFHLKENIQITTQIFQLYFTHQNYLWEIFAMAWFVWRRTVFEKGSSCFLVEAFCFRGGWSHLFWFDLLKIRWKRLISLDVRQKTSYDFQNSNAISTCC